MINLITMRKEIAKLCEQRDHMEANPNITNEELEEINIKIYTAMEEFACVILNNMEALEAAQEVLDRYNDQETIEQPQNTATVSCLYVQFEDGTHAECLWRGIDKPKKYADTLIKDIDGTYYDGVIKNIYHISETEFNSNPERLMEAYPAPKSEEIEVAVIRLDCNNRDYAELWLHDEPINVNDRAIIKFYDGDTEEGTILYRYKVNRDAINGFEADIHPIQ